ncbi:MAG: lactate racemase domain-containing protein [Elusimicrobiota bacterium]
MLSNEIVLNYGAQVLRDFIPQKTIDEKKFLPLILPQKLPVIKNVKEKLLSALEKPIGKQKPLSSLIKENYKDGDICIITDDHDRPNIHTRLLLPILVDLLLTTYHLPLTKIKVVIATGTHRPPTDDELKKILGEQMFGKVNYVIHKCKENNIEVGELNGQKIKIDSVVYNSDIIIPLTDVENHYFAGVAGGPKSFCPGVCDMDTIRYEHLQMFGPEGFAKNVGLGIMDKNPVFETKVRIVKTILESLRKQGKQVYTIVSIIDTEDDLVYLEGGELFEAHRRAAEVLKNVWTVYTEKQADIIIAGASAWGVNLYQMGKATHAAYRAVKKGGTILVVAPCNQSWGNEEFKNLMKIGMDELNKHDDKCRVSEANRIKKALTKVVEVVSADYKIGKQKPVDIFQILNYLGWGNLHIIQDGIPESDYHLLPFLFWGKNTQSPQERLNTWVQKYLQNKTITVLNNPGYLVKPLE